MPCFEFQYRLRVGRVKCLFVGRNFTKILKKCPLSFARIRKNMYLCSKNKDDVLMSATDYLNNAQEWLAQQSQRTIDYQWEIQHHNQMHKAYETSW